MLARNGRQLASNFIKESSAVEKRFFDVLFRWSSVRCVGSGSGMRRSSTNSSPTPSTPPIVEADTTSQKVRQVMRSLAHPVVILTTTAPPNPGAIDWNKPVHDALPDPSQYRGMTLSSFTSLSMSPQPFITFNIGFPSRTLSALTETRHFLLHILKAYAKSPPIADAFTKGNAVTAPGGDSGSKITTAFDLAAQVDDTFIVHDHIVQGPLKQDIHLPRIQSASVKAVLECEVLGPGELGGGGLIRVGDHVLVIAKINGIPDVGEFTPHSVLEREKLGKTNIDMALCYASGDYCYASVLQKGRQGTRT